MKVENWKRDFCFMSLLLSLSLFMSAGSLSVGSKEISSGSFQQASVVEVEVEMDV